MRSPFLRAGLFPDELVCDLFAGAGGASVGIEDALGRPVDFAINHSAAALAVHQKNHPETTHIQSDVWEVDPREICGSRKVGFLWASPDCKHFSKAKGTKPLSKRTRSLAWVVVRWARAVRPRVIVVENVEEFMTWGPLDANNRPVASKVGRTFRAWCGKLSDLGYKLEYRILSAADYGAPTIRKRIFLIASRDREIAWPRPTHGAGLLPLRIGAECIDWSIPCVSIFGRKKPLVAATMRRIAAGIDRYVLRGRPFIMPVTHHGAPRHYGLDEPFRTITAAHRGEFALCSPFVVRHGHYSTKTGAGLIPGRGAGTFRGQPLTMPLSTVCATDDRHVVLPVIVPHYGGSNGNPTAPRSLEAPLPTVTSRDHTSLVAAWLTKFYGESRHGSSLYDPMPTVLCGGGTGGGHAALTAAFMTEYLGGDSSTNTIVTLNGQRYKIVDIGLRMLAAEELKRAQGFRDDYDLSPARTKTKQIELIGNSVCRQVAEAIVRANLVAY